MATPPFHYEPMFQKGPDTTEYYLLTKDYVSVSEFEGKPILKVAKEGLTAMANAAFRDVSFMLRRSHNEQVAKILYEYAAFKGCDMNVYGDLSAFADMGKVSNFAKEPMTWAVAEGLIQGMGGKLNPQSTATRAQVATILMRFLELYSK